MSVHLARIAVGRHGDAARPHPHDKLRAIDPCAVQIRGSMVCVCFFCVFLALTVAVFIVKRLSIESLNQL